VLQRIFSFLYGNVPVRFPSDFSLATSIERLRERTKRSVFSALLRQAAVGPVDESRVRLHRVIPMFGNSFKPIFVGRFDLDEGRVVLDGRFTMFRLSKIFMTIWLVFALIWTILATAAALRTVVQDRGRIYDDPVAWLVPLVGVLFFLAGVAFVRGCWWLSRKDMVFLTSVIQAALHDVRRPDPAAGTERRR
jgi:hypothetical protein